MKGSKKTVSYTHLNGKISAYELKAVEDKEIERLINKQKELGYHVITDGEFRRARCV